MAELKPNLNEAVSELEAMLGMLQSEMARLNKELMRQREEMPRFRTELMLQNEINHSLERHLNLLNRRVADIYEDKAKL